MRENTQRSIFVGGAERVTLPNPFKIHSKSGEKSYHFTAISQLRCKGSEERFCFKKHRGNTSCVFDTITMSKKFLLYLDEVQSLVICHMCWV